jgi:hypothetical protein
MKVQETEQIHLRAFVIIQGSQSTSVTQQNTRIHKITYITILPVFFKFKHIGKFYIYRKFGTSLLGILYQVQREKDGKNAYRP